MQRKPHIITDFFVDYYQRYWRHRLSYGKIYADLPTRVKVALAYLGREFTTILDIGCGDGVLGKALLRQQVQRRVVGLDISETALKLARPYYNRIFQADISRLEIGWLPEKFEAITALEVIEHVIDPERLVRFAREHLTDDGRFIVSFPNTAWWKYRWDLMRGKFIDESPAFSDFDHIHFYTLDSLEKLLTKNGFFIETVDGDFVLPQPFSRLPKSFQNFIGRKRPSVFGYQVVAVCRKVSKKPVVVHGMLDFLNPSEPWLYGQLTSHRQWQPMVICRNERNLEQFPYRGLFKFPLLTDGMAGVRGGKLLFRKTLAGLQRLADWGRPDLRFYENICRKAGARMIHVHYGAAGYRLLPLAGRLRVPLIVSFYGTDAYRLPWPQWLWQRRYRQLFRQASRIIVKSKLMRKRLIRLGCPGRKILPLDAGLILTRIIFKQRLPTKRPRLLIACRLVPIKGVDFAIKAFSSVLTQFSLARLTIIGSGPEEGRLRRLVNDLSLVGKVIFKPFMPHVQLLAEVDKYDIFIQPSVTLAGGVEEGLPNSLLERMAAGMVVVATRHGGMSEAIEDGANGFLVKEADEEELAKRLVYLLNHQEDWVRLGKAARLTIEKNYEAFEQTRFREQLYSSLTKVS
ncbi:hypothetical protein A3A66_01330 [Microgenomates group bacterium RIFCSPLOWO2_01_FULL_46_13]|nr:MAG: hypothetical protein A2783_02365 [Microgenomates group bacterium RIFCSPHIGHO2_01_FULL_45_11]OGV94643.1 MAG: hypothetical protein A3A66_01330 [Microgenomates group bacterium RIFCSPLOWO2_01_FULL_46_13]